MCVTAHIRTKRKCTMTITMTITMTRLPRRLHPPVRRPAPYSPQYLIDSVPYLDPSVARPPAVSLASFVPHPPSPPKKKLNTEPKPSERGAAQVAQWTRAETQTQTRAHALASTGPTPLSLVVIGHVDAGKSTVVGHLLYQMGTVPPKTVHKYTKEAQTAGKASAAFAWVVDAADAERTRGVTMDVGVQSFTTRTKHVTLLDAPGHRDFIPQMLTGATQADVALLVVPAALGEFEAAVDDGGQTKEHTLLVRSLGVTHVVVAVNKMDTVGWTHERFRTIQEQLATWLDHAGFRRNKVQFVPVSGLTGVNLKQTGGDDRVAWYTGPSLVEAIDALTPPQRQIAKPFRMTVADVSKSKRLGHTISGRIYAGAAAVGDSVRTDMATCLCQWRVCGLCVSVVVTHADARGGVDSFS
ncbi:hypothetical protein PsorP6_014782 [Peronosclerospora sorghi]|uniref:Uncharacterized protein n=1 Tax=Peronosclerospora sorghi TaxID=230839 RepID=A0ACC0VU28_9STRA|nr:hypothetical protein PsorP6_014782 [Peronosclerospora sorghi]